MSNIKTQKNNLQLTINKLHLLTKLTQEVITMPIPRKALVSLDNTPNYHVVSRCVRRSYLFGVVDNKDFSHRRDAIVERLAELTQLFCIDISAYAIMSNHYHLVIRIQKHRAIALSLTEVAQRWTQLYCLPCLAQRFAANESLTDAESVQAIQQIEERRSRLYDLSWFMRCLNEPIARMANQEDDCTGRFWEGRFKSQALLDEKAELQAMAYVDLNPVRAKAAQSLEDSDFTSIQARCTHSVSPMAALLLPFSKSLTHNNMKTRDKNFDKEHIAYNFDDYIQLVEWTGRQIKDGKKGFISSDVRSVLDALQMNQEAWVSNCIALEKYYRRAIGCAARMKDFCGKTKQQRIVGIAAARRAFG